MSEQKNKRNTNQKRAIEQVFRSIQRPLTPEEVLSEGRQHVPSLNQATVYRNLKALVEDGYLTKVHLPSAGTLYEKSNKAHHHHFHCRNCKKSYEINDCALSHKTVAPKGFVVEDHEIFFYGSCPKCATGG